MSSKKIYPILPIRNDVLLPTLIMPFAVGRAKSTALIKEAALTDNHIVLVAQKNEANEDPSFNDLHSVGTVATIRKVTTSNGAYHVIVEGVKRVRLESLTQEDPYFLAECSDIVDTTSDADELEALFPHVKEKMEEALSVVGATTPKETKQMLDDETDPSKYCDFIAGSLGMDVAERQAILEELDVNARLKLVLSHLTKQLVSAEVAAQLRETWEKDTEKSHKEYFLRNQLKIIKKELGEDDDLDDLEARIDRTPMSEEAHQAAKKQVGRLKTMQPSSSEYSVTLNYIETLLDIPWSVQSDDNLNLDHARELFDDEHYAMETVKKRLIEQLAVKQLRNDLKSPILCLAGPPGTGKTSISKSIARALGRKFVRVSLGGVHDESEIRGHRRTYVGAMPGRIVKALIKAGTNNPVILLDELDKMGRDMKGDPEAAMLEVLDPEQNYTFSDHFVEVPIDLSNVLFVATANVLSQISAPLRDRMEIIEIPSYTSFEKKQIAINHLIPKQIDNHGITEGNIQFPEEAVDYIIDHYTREAGVRGLERQVASVCRSVAVQVASQTPDNRDSIQVSVATDFITEALGPERFFQDVAERVSTAGIATGLAWTQSGGDILFIEASKMVGEGKVKLTGQLGDVMKESAEAAISFLRSNASQFGMLPTFYKDIDLHIHFPAGAVPKDGPSAGITIFSALLSVLTGIEIRNDVAMTGEITLRGHVLPVGGIKEKLTAAHRAGIKRILIPQKCMKDLVDLNQEVKDGLEIIPVDRVSELPALIFTKPLPVLPAEVVPPVVPTIVN